MPGTVIVGAQWGDEGKGKVVDLLSEEADVIVRYAGGPNAGHTLVVGGEKTVFRLVPSGILHRHTTCLLGQGMVLAPDVLIGELTRLRKARLEPDARLSISPLAHLLLPYHVLIDGLREGAKDRTKIGTTKRGIGPCYEDKAGRRGLRMGDLLRPSYLRARLAEALKCWQPTIEALGGEPPKIEALLATLTEQAAFLAPLIRDVTTPLSAALHDGKRVLFEGAQGTLLDIDVGTYPYVTSSSAVAGGAATGSGVGPRHIGRVIGITKAYTTRVGGGPFPTELNDERGEYLQKQGHEFGSVTGRPRRTGWLDVPALLHAKRVNSLDALALTKLDVLSGLDDVKLCVGYEGVAAEAFPGLDDQKPVKPVYETFPGWTDDLTGCRKIEELPKKARAYVQRLVELTDLPADIVSVGPDRTQTITVRGAFD